MDIDITIKNFRCFADEKPVTISLRSNGFVAFVGVNNSGKSSLLKMFYELRDVFKQLAVPSNIIEYVRSQPRRPFSIPSAIADKNQLFHNRNDRDVTLEIKCNVPSNGGDQSVTELLITLPRNTNTFRVAFPKLQAEELPTNTLYNDCSILVGRQGAQTTLYSLKPICAAMRTLSQAMYIGAFRNAINVGTNERYFDIEIGQAFIKKWRQYKTGPDIAHNEAALRLTRDICTLFGFKSLEINPTPDDESLQFFVNDKSFKLAEIGAGIAQFVVVLANVAIKKPTFVFIDEPELHLHPTLQMDFLTTLGSYTSEGVVFSTHNIGLARAAADRIYSVRMRDGVSEVRELESTPRLPEFVGELSFSGSRELGFDGLLLVEGRTDVKTIQQFLRLYKKDHRVVLIPLRGDAGMTEHSESELEELKRISSNISALIDSELTAADADISDKRKDFKKLCESADIPCHILQRRATENYLADHAVKRVYGDSYRALAEYESPKESPMNWNKRNNWRIAREMRLEDLEGTDLGDFLKRL